MYFVMLKFLKIAIWIFKNAGNNFMLIADTKLSFFSPYFWHCFIFDIFKIKVINVNKNVNKNCVLTVEGLIVFSIQVCAIPSMTVFISSNTSLINEWNITLPVIQ